jgi:hypothetical protein
MSAFACLADRTIKVTHNGETRRGKLTVPADSTSAEAFAVIKATVAALFEISEEGVWVKYADEEGDLCTLTGPTITDLVALAAEGTLRLTLEVKTTSTTTSDPDSTQCEAPSQSASIGPKEATTPPDDALRLAIRAVLEKIPAGPKMMVHALLQGMDAATLPGLAGMAMEHLAAQNLAAGEQPQQDGISQLLGVKSQLLSMDPDALKALLLSELERVDSARNADSESNLGGAPPDFMQMIGAALSGKGIGKGTPGVPGGGSAGGSQAPNPMHDLLGGLFAAKGAGKGNGPCPAAGQAPNLMQDLLGGLFAAKGAGKGNGAYPVGGQAPNPMQDILGAFLAAKGAGKGTGSCPCPMTVNPASTPAPTHFEGASAPPASDTDSASRETFEASVEDLVSMGLVSDKQVARELLTTHGDISTVVSVLTGDH